MTDLEAFVIELARKDAEKLARKATTPSKFYYREDGKLKRSASKPTGMDVESFTGKTGTVRRNRKGRTRILPNGSRRYIRSWWDSDGIVAYKANP